MGKESKYNPFLVEYVDVINLVEGREPKLDFSTLKHNTPYSLKLLLYIFVNLKNDYITLRWKDIYQELEGTYVTFHKAIKDLERINILRRKGRNEYWTNPAILFQTSPDVIRMAQYYKDVFEEGLKKYAPQSYFSKLKELREFTLNK